MGSEKEVHYEMHEGHSWRLRAGGAPANQRLGYGGGKEKGYDGWSRSERRFTHVRSRARPSSQKSREAEGKVYDQVRDSTPPVDRHGKRQADARIGFESRKSEALPRVLIRARFRFAGTFARGYRPKAAAAMNCFIASSRSRRR
jgi:hypothetical protein